MDLHHYWLKIIYKRKSDQRNKKITTKDLSRVHSNSPATVLEKLWHLDALIYQVISTVIGSTSAC